MGTRPGLVRKPFHTLVSVLDGDPETLLLKMNGSTRNQIRQADKLGVTGDWVELAAFVSFFNHFAADKGIHGTTVPKLRSFGDALRLSSVSYDGRPLAMHATLWDRQTKRTRSLLSASARFLDPEDRKLIGKANRWLHWWDMKMFQAEGCTVYDWGGYAKDTEDPERKGINEFKEGFGGTLLEESHYFPLYLSYLVS
ncbi:MAG: hypothetical protein HKM06_07290 [Spirochaetales bacterium]|nr:hypothetical protein [Spirochaetales bacterium]